MRLLDADWGSGKASVWLEGRIMGTGEERGKDEFREPGRTGLGRALNAR